MKIRKSFFFILSFTAIFFLSSQGIYAQQVNPKIEAQRGQIALEMNHFLQAIQVITSSDAVHYDFRGQHGQPNLKETLIFQKTIDYQYVVALEIRRVTKKGKICRLLFQTMYIRKSAAS